MPNPNFPNNPGYNLYVGARYVPIFSDVNNGVWDDNTAYEPLTIVSYLGNSYTSKTFVPIGVNPENSEYWALTGNYNAQIAEINSKLNSVNTDIMEIEGDVSSAQADITRLDREVAQLDTELENLSNSTTQSVSTLTQDVLFNRALLPQLKSKKYVLFGDSLCEGYPQTPARGWGHYFQHATTCDGYIVGNGGMGFTNKGTTAPWNNMNAIEALEWLKTNIAPDVRKNYKGFVIGLGINDLNSDLGATTRNANTLITNIHAVFPNATIYYWFDASGHLMNLPRQNSSHTIEELMPLLNNVFFTRGCVLLENLSYCMYGVPQYYVNTSTDRTHLTAAGYQYLGTMVANAVQGGNSNIRIPINITFTPNETWTSMEDGFSYVEKGVLHLNEIVHGTPPATGTRAYFQIPIKSPNGLVASDELIPCCIRLNGATSPRQFLFPAFFNAKFNYVYYATALPSNVPHSSVDGVIISGTIDITRQTLLSQ